MRKLPTYVAAAFLAIQLQRVADFVGVGMSAGRYLGWAFAIGIATAVFVTSYWTRQSITRKDGEDDKRDVQARRAAWIGLVVFVGLDGAFNLAETLRVLQDESLYWYAVIYGVSPTVAAAGLGMLQGRIDRLPVAPRKTVLSAVRNSLVRRLSVEDTGTPVKPTVKPVAVTEKPVEPTGIRVCDIPGCGWSTMECKPDVRNDPDRSQRALAGHKRSHSLKAIKPKFAEVAQ